MKRMNEKGKEYTKKERRIYNEKDEWERRIYKCIKKEWGIHNEKKKRNKKIIHRKK